MLPSKFRALSAAGLAASLAVCSAPAAADPAAFYAGKQLEIYVGFSAGGGYDTYARTLARYYGDHIPGKPDIIVKNMPGGSGIKLANWLYAVAPKDGTVLATIARGAPVHDMLGGPGVRFDPLEFTWIGSMNNEVSVCVTAARSAVKTFAQLRQTEVVVGGQGKSSDSEVFARFAKNLLGARIKLISGYPGTKESIMAMERGEVDGNCGWSWTSAKKLRPEWVKPGGMNILMQMALVKHPDLPDVPLVTEFARNESEKAQMELVFSRQTMGRPFMGAPGVPQDRVAALRTAFMATLSSAPFKAFADKAGLEINPVSGEDVQALVERVRKTPKEVVAAVRHNITAD
jgi:tripartite-type tricarboxylate transporter receptor subunit TctC